MKYSRIAIRANYCERGRIDTALGDLIEAVTDAAFELSDKKVAYLLAGLALEQILKKAPLWKTDVAESLNSPLSEGASLTRTTSKACALLRPRTAKFKGAEIIKNHNIESTKRIAIGIGKIIAPIMQMIGFVLHPQLPTFKVITDAPRLFCIYTSKQASIIGASESYTRNPCYG